MESQYLKHKANKYYCRRLIYVSSGGSIFKFKICSANKQYQSGLKRPAICHLDLRVYIQLGYKSYKQDAIYENENLT
jgi:hypothetical protein